MVEVSTDKVDAEVPAPADGVVTKILRRGRRDGRGRPAAGRRSIRTAARPPRPRPARQGRPWPSGETQPLRRGIGSRKRRPEPKARARSFMPGDEQPAGVTRDRDARDGRVGDRGDRARMARRRGRARSRRGDTVVEVSTDKVDAEVPAPAAGTITEVLVGPTRRSRSASRWPRCAKGDGARRRRRRRERAQEPSSARAGARSEADVPAEDEADSRACPPVARRAAEANGVDLKGRSRAPAPGGKITKSDVLCGRERRRRRADAGRPPRARQSRCAAPRRSLARAMNESRSIPTATSFRELAVDTLDAKRKALNEVLKERGMKVSFTHLIAWAIVKAAAGVAGDGARLRGARRQADRDRAGRRQPRHRGGRRAQGPALPAGPLHQGRRLASTSPASTPTTRS